MSNAYNYRPPRTLRPTLIGFLIAGILCDLLYAAESMVIGLMYPDFYNLDAPFAPGEEIITNLGLLLAAVGLLTYIPTVVLFCCWFFRANANARALGAQGMSITPGWSVGWWFIPIANLFKPYEAAHEIYRASDPDRGPEDWRLTPKPALINWWWALWLIGGFVGQIDMRMGLSDDYQIAHLSSWTGVVTALFSVSAAILVIRMIRSIDGRQLVKATENPAATQGYCLACDYDLSGSVGQAACPECGEPMPRAITG